MVQNIALDKAEFATCINGKLWFEGNCILSDLLQIYFQSIKFIRLSHIL